MIKENIAHIQKNIAIAQSKSNVAAKEVTLMAVTKTVAVEQIKQAIAGGLTNLGENRVQELMEKYPLVTENVQWHLIGHLQTNKVKYIIDKIAMLHSLESLDLAQEIEKRAAAKELILPVLIEVNVAEEESKFGLHINEVKDFLREICQYSHVGVAGLMTVAPYWDNRDDLRSVFRQLRQLSESIALENIPGVKMSYLSMGMSNDYQIAVEEGANIVRVGSSIFGQR